MFLVTQGEKRVAYENSRPSSLPTRVAFRVSQAKKTGNIDENLQRNSVARQVEGFCISYFAAFNTTCILQKNMWFRPVNNLPKKS